MVFLWFSYGSHGFPGFANHHRNQHPRRLGARGREAGGATGHQGAGEVDEPFLASAHRAVTLGEKRLGKPTRKSPRELIVD